MSSLENRFTSKIINKTDLELQEYVNNPSDYQKEAVIAAINELERRGTADIETVKLKEEIVKPEKEISYSAENWSIPDGLPSSISTAAKFIYISIGLGVINFFIVESTTGKLSESNLFDIISAILTLGIIVLLAYMIHLGKKGARTVFLVLFLLGIVFYLQILNEFFRINMLSGILSVLQTGFQVLSLIFLFKSDSKEWYSKASNS